MSNEPVRTQPPNREGDTMNIHFMWKDVNSGAGDCHAIYEVDGGYILVGDILGADELAQVKAVGTANNSGIAATESALFVKANVLDRLRGA